MSHRQRYDIGANEEIIDLFVSEDSTDSMDTLSVETKEILQVQSQRLEKLESLLFLLVGRSGIKSPNIDGFGLLTDRLNNQNNISDSVHVENRFRFAHGDGQRYDNGEVSFSHS